MRTHQIQVSNGREALDEIRRELFQFSEVLEVFDTSRPDALVVVCAGRPRPGEWLSALRAAGYDAPARRRSISASRAPSPEPRSVASRPRSGLPRGHLLGRVVLDRR
jgi:hypothetical protein